MGDEVPGPESITMSSFSSTAMAGPAQAGTSDTQVAKPPRQAPQLSIPRVDSVGEFGLMITRQLSQCRRYGAKLAVMWLEAQAVEAVDPASPYDLQASLMTAVGRRLRSRVRGTDTVLQVGEGSFGVLLIDAGAPEAELVRVRLHHALAGSYGVGEGQVMHVRLQIGASASPEGGTRAAELAQLARADLQARAA
jgi:GGDEF domain-containing protein